VRELGYLDAAFLGIVQGLTEFLPVSSSAHLALTQRRLQLDPDSLPILFFDLVTHVGTLLAVGVVYAGPIRRFGRRLWKECAANWPRRRIAFRIALLALVGTVPTAVIGLAFKSTLEAAFDKPNWIGLGLVVTGTLLLLAARLPRGRRGWGEFRGWQAVGVGVAQGVAILPGVSRSGSTICAATFFGLRRRWAAEFSFLLAFPAILGAALVKLKDVYDLPAEAISTIPWGPILLGGALSCLVGMVAVVMLVRLVRRARLHFFAPYCFVLGLLTLVGYIA
jgi:undecaprenyl-diphosphatase